MKIAPFSHEKISINCTKCKRKNFARRDYLKLLTHPYWCKYCRPHWRPKTFEDRIKLSLARRKYALNESFFEKINNEEKAYWLGFLAGDGAITENKVRLSLSLKDKDHAMKFKEAVGWTGKDYLHINTSALEVYFRSFKMVNDLAKYFVTARKTFTLRFPEIPKEIERDFIRGVFDADGCINKARRVSRGKGGQIYIFYGGEFNIEGNSEFLTAVQSRFVELGLPAGSLDYPGKRINRIRYGGINQLRKIYGYLYNSATVFLERKRELFEDIMKDYRHEIIKMSNDLAMVG
ncbi:MAG: hypothetical protein Q8N65_00525 [bacterium]|nr:hypothetical protein [bacterium]